MKTNWVRDIDSLYDFIGYVVLGAPDRFPHEDYLSEGDQMNLERAFAELRRGVEFIERDSPGANAGRGLGQLLDQALRAYQQGDVTAGAHCLQDLQDKVFKAPQ